jgi:glycosyltransferase involved in cell wall biosynthesis
MNYAPGARTWQLARPLAGAGHAVCVVAQRIPGAYGGDVEPIAELERSGIPIYTLDLDGFRHPGVVDGLVDAFRPDIVIGAASTVPALRAIEVAGDRPVWVDLFGDLLAEAQARLTVHPDEQLAPYRDVLAALLERGDAFSAVSDRQRDAVLGQLGLVGRLNRDTIGCELVSTVPCSVRPADGPARSDGPVANPDDVDDADVVVLWSGGFNTWCDVDTLVNGVERAMASDPRIRLVTTGGSIPGHDDVSYQEFLDRVRGSELRDRFVVKGPVDAELAARYQARADLGVVTEKPLVERRLGSSGRVLGWLSAGVPVICTGVSELGGLLAERGLARIYHEGDPEDLARAILDVAGDPVAARDRALRAQAFACEAFSARATAEPLVRWVEHARRAPDAGVDNPLALTPVVAASKQLDGVHHELDEARAEYHAVRAELGTIHTSRMWRIWMSYYSLVSWFRPGARRRR